MTIYINKNESTICLFSLNESTSFVYDRYVEINYVLPNYFIDDLVIPRYILQLESKATDKSKLVLPNYFIDDLVIPRYILQLESKATDKSKLLWLNVDISVNTNRINKFMIEEVPLIDEDLDNQKVHLDIDTYNYYVWETYGDVLDITLSNKVIESGILHCIGNNIPIVVANVPKKQKHIYKKQ